MAHALSTRYFSERKAVIASVHQDLTGAGMPNQVANGSFIGPGNFSVSLPDRQVSWLFPKGCDITAETFRAADKQALVMLVGLGYQEISENPAFKEKWLDLVLMEVTSNKEVAISTDSFSPIAKAIFIIGGGALVGGCEEKKKEEQPPTCEPYRPNLRSYERACPAAEGIKCPEAKPFCNPSKKEDDDDFRYPES